MSDEIHVNDVGTVFEATVLDENDVVVDLSSATIKQLLFRKPNGTVVTKTASLSGTGLDGKIRYVTVAGDLDRQGTWQIQGYVEVGGGKWHTDWSRQRVYPNLG